MHVYYTHNINRGLGVYLEKAFRMDMKYTYLLMKHSFSERGIATLHVSKRNPAYFFSESQETTFSDPTPFLPIYTPVYYTHNINRRLGVYLEKAFRMDMKYTYLLMKHSFSER